MIPQLQLRPEFQGKKLKGTAIDLQTNDNRGATQIPAGEFFQITYPTRDLLKAIEAIGPSHGAPVVLMGERGSGKSHLIGTLYHVLAHPEETGQWLGNWAKKLGDPAMGAVPLRLNSLIICESLHNNRYGSLWELLFDRHPEGKFIHGKWMGMGDQRPDVPPRDLILEMFQKQPTALLFDEFQTWFESLSHTREKPKQKWAFNFIQNLSEIAAQHPELLVLVVSIRNGDTEAYKQIHRINPILVDFKAAATPEKIQSERRALLLHRLFENRSHIPPADIERTIHGHIEGYFRLYQIPGSDQEGRRTAFLESWPFSPLLLQLLEDQILKATEAQETRDLIKILASLYKSHHKQFTILTPAHFNLESESSGLGALLDSVSNKHHRALREVAQRNLVAVRDAVPDHLSRVQHLSPILGALWIRSIAIGNDVGGSLHELQLDVSGIRPVDPNKFNEQINLIEDHSFNIHRVGDKLLFREEENPRAKLKSHARNDRLFQDGADTALILRQVKYVLSGSDSSSRLIRVVALGKNYLKNPWEEVPEEDRPDRWNDDRIPLIVFPEHPQNLGQTIGPWLKQNLLKSRNGVRFLIPQSNTHSIFGDSHLKILSRMVLKGEEWRNDPKNGAEYKGIAAEMQKELQGTLKKRFAGFCILKKWEFNAPEGCEVVYERLSVEGSKIPEAIENTIRTDLFIHEDFEALLMDYARQNKSLETLFRDLQEPRPNFGECLPWLGVAETRDRIIKQCAKGTIAIDLRGGEQLHLLPGESSDAAWLRMAGKLNFTGRQLAEVKLQMPNPGATPTRIDPQPLLPVGNSPSGVISNPPFSPAPGNPLPIFDPPPPTTRKRLSHPANSPLNLLGTIETWGIGPATPVREVQLKVGKVNGSQLREILKRLPDGLTFDLSLEKED